MRLRLGLLLGLALLLGACSSAPAPPWIELFDGRSLEHWTVTEFGGEGDVTIHDAALHLDFGSPLTGITWQGTPPTGDYQLEATAARLDGTDFFCGLTFPIGDQHLTLVLGGWGGSVSGLSSLDADDAARNETRTVHGFQNDRDYALRLTVTTTTVTVELDGEPFLHADLTGRAIGLRPEVELSCPLGIACFDTRARIRKLRWRPLTGRPTAR